MLSIEEAKRIILSSVDLLPYEELPLLESLDRVLIEDVHSPFDLPMTDTSAMDGYAFYFAGLTDDRLKVSGFLPAGALLPAPVPPGEAIRIMTGAPVPPGCDTVVPVEETEQLPEGEILLARPVKQGAHVRLAAEDVRKGDCVVAAGATIRPQEIGMAASLGLGTLKVRRSPRVAILATGDELLEAGAGAVPGKIFNSNSYSLAAQALKAGGEPHLLGIARDDLPATKALIQKGNQADLLLISGGVSVGDRDYVKDAILDLGGEIVFWKVNMKPGKPVVFARLNGKPIFALPGNPVAAMVGFEMFVRPALLKITGHGRLFRPKLKALLTAPVHNKGDRPHLIRASLATADGGYSATPFASQSSANLRSMTASNALIEVPPDTKLAAGAEVEVILLDDLAAILPSSHL